MLKNILLILTLTIGLSSYSQSFPHDKGLYTFTCDQFSYKMLDSLSNTWEDWSEWYNCNLLIKVDVRRLRVTIGSEDLTFTYKVQAISIKDTTEYNDMILYSLDRDSLNCSLHVLTYKDNTPSQLMVEYLNIQITYVLKE